MSNQSTEDTKGVVGTPPQLDITYFSNLEYAVMNNLIDEVRILLRDHVGIGINVSYGDRNRTLLMMAAEKGHDGILELLFKANMDPRMVDSDGKTALMIACIEDNWICAKMLMSYGENLNHGDDDGLTSLMWCAVLGRMEVARSLLKRRAKHHLRDLDGCTAVILSCKYNSPTVLSVLLSFKATVDDTDDDGVSGLMWACWKGNYECVRQLLAHNAEVNYYCNFTGKALLDNHMREEDKHTLNNGHRPALMLAAIKGHHKIVDLILKNGVDINATDINKRTALHWASRFGYTKVVRSLIKQKAEINVMDYRGSSPIMMASKYGHSEIVEILLDAMSDLNSADTLDGMTALMMACEGGYLDPVIALLDEGARSNATDVEKRTALHFACLSNDEEIVQQLLDYDVNVNHPDENKVTPLMIACTFNNGDILHNLIDAKANINATDVDLWTPLSYACASGYLPVARALLDNGANADHADSFGQTALHLAVCSGALPIVEFLMDFARKTNARSLASYNRCFSKDNNGRTPLLLACICGQAKVLSRLLEMGVSCFDVDNDNKTSLIYAAEHGHEECVAIIIKHIRTSSPDASVLSKFINLTDSSGYTALMHGSVRGFLGLVGILLENGADSTTKDNLGRDSFWYSACRTHNQVCQLLLSHYHKKTPVTVESYKSEQLLICAQTGDKEGAISLVNAKADVHSRDNAGKTPLMYAAHHGHLNIMEFLFAVGSDPCLRDNDQNTALHLTVQQGNIEATKILISWIRRMEREEHLGRIRTETGIQILAKSSTTPEVSKVMSMTHNARLSAQTPVAKPAGKSLRFNNTPVYFDNGLVYFVADEKDGVSRSEHSHISRSHSHAIDDDDIRLSKRLMNKNVASSSNSFDYTTFNDYHSPEDTQIAGHASGIYDDDDDDAKIGTSEVIDAMNKFERTALMIACESGKKEMASLLLEHRADPYITDSNNNSALILSLREGDAKCAAVLLESCPEGDSNIDCTNFLLISSLDAMELEDKRKLVGIMQKKKLPGHEALKQLTKKNF